MLIFDYYYGIIDLGDSMKESEREIVEAFFNKLSDSNREKLQLALLEHVDEYRKDPIGTIVKCLNESVRTEEESDALKPGHKERMEKGKRLTEYLNGPIDEYRDKLQQVRDNRYREIINEYERKQKNGR